MIEFQKYLLIASTGSKVNECVLFAAHAILLGGEKTVGNITQNPNLEQL